MASRKLRFAVLLIAFALVAAACGGAATTQPEAPPTPIADIPEATGDAPDDPKEATTSTALPDTTAASGSVSGSGIDVARQAVVRIVNIGDVVLPDAEGISVGTGSGFIIDPSGLAVTNNHVAGGAGIIEVTVDGETETRNARVVGLSECADLALIDIEGEGFPFVELYEGSVAVGEEVLSAGYPLSTTEFTLTRGIVSTAEIHIDSGWASVDAVIEHEARIRGGNSGGPLFNEDGYVVGVNYAGNDEFDFNWAISAAYARPIIDHLAGGSDWEGIGLNAVAYAIGDVPGLWVNAIETGSPADKAGIKPGDFVLDLEGVPLGLDGTLGAYCDVLRTQGIDEELAIEIVRPSTGEILEGNLNSGEKLEVVFSPAAAGDSSVASPGTPYSDSQFVTLTDDTGLMSFQVPSELSDILSSPVEVAGYGSLPAILAAENIATAFGSDPSAYTGNGAALLAFTDPSLDMLTTVVEFAESDLAVCDLAGDPENFSANGFEGVLILLNNCSESGSSLFYVGAQIPGEDRFIVLGIQAVDQAMLDAVATILTSFRWER